jgi:hypothetical protein
MSNVFVHGFLATLAVTSIVSLAHDACAEGPAANDADATQRIAKIQLILDERDGRAKVWQYGWAGIGYGIASGFGVLSATTSDSTQRLDFAFAAGGTVVDTTVHMLGSINVHAAGRLRLVPDATPEERRLKLVFAESELREAALAEQKRRSLVFGHLLPAGFATAAGLVLWLGFGHLKGAAINTAAGIVVNEVRLLTQPTSAREAWEAYQNGSNSSAAAWRYPRATFTWSPVLSPLGCGIVGTF